MRRTLGLFLLCPLLVGCGATAPSSLPNDAQPPPQVASLGVYLARGSLFHTPEFEQYRLSGNTLFVECGVVRGGRPQSRDRHVFRLSPGELETLNENSAALIDFLQRRGSSFEDPGSQLGFTDPGQARISIKRVAAPHTSASPADSAVDASSNQVTELRTSLDEVASESLTSPLRKTVTSLRAIARDSLLASSAAGAPLCDNATFYGLE